MPEAAFEKITRLGVVLDDIIEEYRLDALALRCWIELQQQLGISACVLLGELNNRGIPAACEVDVGNAVAMYALTRCLRASRPTCLDWNNNYEDEDDKCILFHCGPVPRSSDDGPRPYRRPRDTGQRCGRGMRLSAAMWVASRPFDFTFGSMMTEAGKLRFYLGEGPFTQDAIPADFFGCGGVAAIPNLQDVLLHIGYNGYRHHVGVTPGQIAAPVREALGALPGLHRVHAAGVLSHGPTARYGPGGLGGGHRRAGVQRAASADVGTDRARGG